jgi:hypothetical protein
LKLNNMARFQIQDKQSGKTLTIEGDTAPNEQEAEGLFQQAGLRQPQPQGILPTIGNAAKGVGNFLMGSAINTAKDLGTAAGLSSTEKMRNETDAQNMQTSKNYQMMADRETDPAKKKLWSDKAREVAGMNITNNNDVVNSFSPDINENYLWRGLKTGSDIASTAALPEIVIGGVKQIPKVLDAAKNIVEKPVDLIKNTAGTVTDIIKNPTKSIAGKNVGKAAEAATEKGAKIAWQDGEGNLMDQIVNEVKKKMVWNKEVKEATNTLISNLTPVPETTVAGQVGQATNLPMIGNTAFTPSDLLKTRTQITQTAGQRIFNALSGKGSAADDKVMSIARNVISKNLHRVAPETLTPDKVLKIYNTFGPLGKFGAAGLVAEILGAGGLARKVIGTGSKAMDLIAP